MVDCRMTMYTYVTEELKASLVTTQYSRSHL
jgi:hypothetical protein